ncbi:MAG TPA: hypothetical protein VNZ52_01925, partial [Candidatus Thermoplasmatota archaeon]|nr:hypothetical protein [Candidatus Thermoplasmatota archaeon]
MRIPVAAAVLALVLPALAGCLTQEEPTAPLTIVEPQWSLEVPVTMNVVLVGTGDRIDPEKLRPSLPETRPLYNLQEFGITRTVDLEPVQLRLTWQFHQAPEAFAQAFFAAAKNASFEGPAPRFLVNYDATSGQNRLEHSLVDGLYGTPLAAVAPPSGQTITYIDAPTLEQWVQDHRAEYGLTFPGAEYTLFVVDSYTDGYLPQDTYHYYYFDDGTIDADLTRPKPWAARTGPETRTEFHTPKDPTSNRGWGGGWNFAWIDLGAAPSWMDYTPWVPPFEDDNVDHPIWDLKDDPAKLHRNLGRHLGDAALVKILRTPIYDFEYRPKWFFPVHVFVESTAVSGKNTPVYGVDVETWLIKENIERAYRDLAPWINTTVTVEYHYLPQDDPGMAQAVRMSEAYGNPTVASAGVIKQYLRDNWAKYVPEVDEDTRVFPQMMFFLDGIYTFWGLNQGGGFADADAWGRPWVAFNHIFDVCVKPEQVPCTKATKWEGAGSLDLLVIHEGGHHVGLTHARDTGILDLENHTDEYYANWFWDSTWSVMTYRHQNPGFDQYDRDVTARGHVGWSLNLAVKRIDALEAAGVNAAEVAAARQGIAESEALLLQGKWQEAAFRATATWDTLRKATPALELLAEETA